MAIITGTTTFHSGVSTWVKDASDLVGYKLTINGISYEAKYCGDYALYYVGMKGGWNSFLFEGKCKQIDDIKDYKYSRNINNFDNINLRATLDFETNRYLVEKTEGWQCSTGWLNDEEADRFASDLLTTPKAYLHNLTTNEIIPVIITESQAEHKTFKSQNHKLVSYTVTMVASQTKYRR